MFTPDPATTGTLIKNIADIFNRLRKRQNNKEFFDIVIELQAAQSKLEDRMRDAESEVTRLQKELSDLKIAHAAEIAKLNQEHADEKKRLAAEPGYIQPYAEPHPLRWGDIGNML